MKTYPVTFSSRKDNARRELQNAKELNSAYIGVMLNGNGTITKECEFTFYTTKGVKYHARFYCNVFIYAEGVQTNGTGSGDLIAKALRNALESAGITVGIPEDEMYIFGYPNAILQQLTHTIANGRPFAVFQV